MTKPNAGTPSNGFDCSGAKDGADANDSRVRETQLLPCPFCGSTENLRVAMEVMDIELGGFYSMSVVCESDDCNIEGPVGCCGDTMDARVALENAIALWNRRARA